MENKRKAEIDLTPSEIIKTEKISTRPCIFFDETKKVREPKPEEIDLVIFHGGCSDGFCACFLYYLYNKWTNPKQIFNVIGRKHGESAPDCKAKNVLVVDFNFSMKDTLKIMEEASSFISIDHHETAKNELEWIPNCHFDMTISGAMLAFNFLFPNQEAPLFVKYVQDRDLWSWKIEGSRAFSAFMFNFGSLEFNIWESYLCDGNWFLDDEKMKEKIIPDGEKALIVQKKNVEIISKMAHTITYDSKIIKIVNSPLQPSEIGELLLSDKKIDLAIIWNSNPQKSLLEFSVRSSKENNFARLFCEKFEGGGGKFIHKDKFMIFLKKGHDSSSGFKININEGKYEDFIGLIFGLNRQ